MDTLKLFWRLAIAILLFLLVIINAVRPGFGGRGSDDLNAFITGQERR